MGGSGSASTSVTTTTYQRRYSRLSCSVFTRPWTGRCWLTLSCPTAWKVGVRPAAAVGWLPLSAVPGDERHLVEPLVGLEPRLFPIARLPPCLLGRRDALEEGSEGGVEPAEGLLLGGEGVPSLPVRVSLADLPELGRLVAVADRDLAHAPGFPPLLKGGVVQVAVVAQQPDRAALLRACRVGPELEAALHGTPFVGRTASSSMYRQIIVSDTHPTEATRYDPDHRVGSRERRWVNSSHSVRLAAPSTWRRAGRGGAGTAAARTGGRGRAWPSAPRPSGSARRTWRRQLAHPISGPPPGTGRRYFRHDTRRYPSTVQPIGGAPSFR